MKCCALALMLSLSLLAVEFADEPLPASVKVDISTTPHLRGLADDEVRARLARTPLVVAQQLAEVYGHKVDEVVYIPAVAAIGRVRLAKLTGDAKMLADVERIAAPYRTGEKPSQPTSDPAYAGHLLFAELAEVTAGDDRERYIALAKSAADALLNDDGTANLRKLGASQMSDAVFMGGPILARVGRLTGEAKYFDAAAAHVDHMAKMLVRDDGLYQHSPLCDAAWGRGNGFPALGLAMILDDLPHDHAQYEKLVATFEKHTAALAPHQDETGCWHQAIDKPESYREYSCTAMIAYALLRGVRQGWLDRETYEPCIERAWRAILTRTAFDGALVDVCTGTGKQKTLQDYFDRPAIVGRDDRGGAMGLLLATEMAARQAQASPTKERLICCGAAEVFIISADAESPTADDRNWRWTAADSPEIPETHRRRFATTDDCKPYGDLLLITSSSQGVALVRRSDKACLFFTLAANAHSACLLPGERIAVASSTGGNALLIYDRRKSGAEVKPLASLELAGAHGAWWDAKTERLWALGDDELLRLQIAGDREKTTLTVEQRWPLPTPGGHDLSPSRDGRSLSITTNTHVYRFELEAEKFAPYDGLAESKGVKSIDEHRALEGTVYHQAAEPNWWSDRIRFAGSDRTIHIAGERLYKVRWDVPQDEPE